MAKKVKSFNVDEGAYNSMVALLKEYGTEASISSLLDKCLKELLNYFKTMEGELSDLDGRREIMRFIIDRKARSTLIHTPDKNRPGEGEPGANRMLTKTIEPQILQAVMMGSTGREVDEPMREIGETELDEEIRYWRDEYEAEEKKLSRAFVKHLRSGEFVLSSDRTYLIEKETGKRYVDFIPNYIVEIATEASEK